jgi:TATA-box binding protein (TBP) (component of TFIID and TFIIIB)
MSCAIPSACPPSIKNYKISFRVPVALRHQINALHDAATTTGTGAISVKKHHNFAVIRTLSCVYIAFFSGFVNITKLRTLTEADDAVRAFKRLIRFEDGDSGCDDRPLYNIDNIIASGHFGRLVSIRGLAERVLNIATTTTAAKDINFSYKPAYFAGAFLKLEGCCTILIFNSGAYSIVGAKTSDDITRIYHRSLALLQ